MTLQLCMEIHKYTHTYFSGELTSSHWQLKTIGLFGTLAQLCPRLGYGLSNRTNWARAYCVGVGTVTNAATHCIHRFAVPFIAIHSFIHWQCWCAAAVAAGAFHLCRTWTLIYHHHSVRTLDTIDWFLGQATVCFAFLKDKSSFLASCLVYCLCGNTAFLFHWRPVSVNLHRFIYLHQCECVCISACTISLSCVIVIITFLLLNWSGTTTAAADADAGAIN